MTKNEIPEGQPRIAKAAFSGLCPQCGAQTMFDSASMAHIRFADRCKSCGLDYTSFNVGDGPAALLIIPVASLIIVLAIWLDIAANPPFWVHVIIWIPVTTIVTFASIRFIKAALLILEHRRSAGEAKGGDS